MFCPSCGVKNEGNPLKCFICGYILPTGERSASEPKRRRQPTFSAAMERFGSIGDRMLALILDRVLLVAILSIPAAAIAERSQKIDPQWTAPVRLILVGSIALVIASLIYHILLEAIFGATLGKGLLGLEVRTASDDGRWLAMTVRNILRLIDAQALYAPAFLVAAFSSRRQRLGDHLAGTVVYEKPVMWGARIALIFIWVALIAGSLWLAAFLNPAWVPDLHRFGL